MACSPSPTHTLITSFIRVNGGTQGARVYPRLESVDSGLAVAQEAGEMCGLMDKPNPKLRWGKQDHIAENPPLRNHGLAASAS